MRKQIRCPALLLGSLFSLAIAEAAEPPAARWEPIGLSGGGAMFSAAISPADPLRMMVHCDMSAAYVTRDGGKTWRMVQRSQLHSCTRCRPAFHPTEPGTVISASGWDRTLKISRDGGDTWEVLSELPEAPRGEIAIDPGDPSRLLAGGGERAFRSRDGGRTWKDCAGVAGVAVGFHFDQASPPDRRVCFAATEKGVWRSDDGGETWREKTKGLPWMGLRSFSGGSNAKARKTVLFCAIPSKAEGGEFKGGVFRSEDRGETWEPAMGDGINRETKAFDSWAMGPVAQYHWVLGSNAKPATVWAFNSNTGVPPPHHATAFRSDDAGRTWRATFHPDPRWKPCDVEPDYTVCAVNQFYQDVPGGAAVAPNDPDVVMFVDGGRCYSTRDGGKTWCAAHTALAPGQAAPGKNLRWLCNGLVVTTTWNFYVDPFQPARRYICYTDIGFARSEDAGKTWSWWALEGRAPWANTCYELAFDPAVPGRIWGAFSDVHDIPNANVIMNRHRSDRGGGVCRSEDFAKSWKPCEGLPDAPATSVVLDPRSPPAARVLYAGFFGFGVWRSADGGMTWVDRNAGLGAAENRRVCRVALHADGTLFALVTALVKGREFQPEGVGLYRSADGGGKWERMTASLELLWPKDFTVDPKDSRIVWLGAADGNGKPIGGLYRTADGGGAWTRVAREGREHFGAYLHPKRPGWVYMTLCEEAPGAGLWLSRDNGATFDPVEELPFRNAMRVAFDPRDEGTIYVTTFGGSVWRGPAG